MKIENCVYISIDGEFVYHSGHNTCPYTGNEYHKFVPTGKYRDAYHYGYVNDTEMIEWAFLFPIPLGKDV